RQVALPELFGYDGRTVAAECLEPGLPGTAGDNGYVPDPRASAMAHAMEKAAAGLVDPRDVETRFMAFETLLLRQGRLPAGVRAPSGPAEAGGHGGRGSGRCWHGCACAWMPGGARGRARITAIISRRCCWGRRAA